MAFKILTDQDEIRLAWNEITSRHSHGFAFQSPDWFFKWCQFSDEKPLVLYVPRRFFLPCYVSKPLPGMRVLRVAGGPAADYEAPYVTSDEILIAGLIKDSLSSLKLDGFYAARSPKEINGLKNPLFQLDHFIHHENTYELSVLDLNENGAPPLLPKKLVADSQRQRRRLEEIGTLHFREPSNLDEALEWLKLLIQQKRQLFTHRKQKLIFDKQMVREFYLSLTTVENKDFKVHLSALLLNAKPIALHWGLQQKDRYLYLLPSYDQGEFRRFSPGRLHLFELLRYCKDQGIEIFDFSLGDEPYKKDFCEKQQQLAHCYLGRTMRFHLYLIAQRAKNELKRKKSRVTRERTDH